MKNKSLIFSEYSIPAGTKKTILFPAPNINTQIKIDIPVHIFHGQFSGPTMFITSALHGDELSSIEIIRRVHNYIRLKHLAGTIITVPVINIHGVIMQTRYLSDRRDLNRSFPGATKGTLAARLAHGVLQQIVKNCDFGIDLHTGASGRMNMPQLRVDLRIPGVKKLAKSFNGPVILDAKERAGSLRQAAGRLGIPVIVYEGGEALRFNEMCVRAGVRGILSVLHHYNMLQSKDPRIIQRPRSVITDTSRWVRAPMSGFVEPVPDILSRTVKKGALLAYIHDPFLINPSTKVIAPFEGMIIGQAQRAMATQGDALYHIASFRKISGVASYIEDYRDEMIRS